MMMRGTLKKSMIKITNDVFHPLKLTQLEVQGKNHQQWKEHNQLVTPKNQVIDMKVHSEQQQIDSSDLRHPTCEQNSQSKNCGTSASNVRAMQLSRSRSRPRYNNVFPASSATHQEEERNMIISSVQLKKATQRRNITTLGTCTSQPNIQQQTPNPNAGKEDINGQAQLSLKAQKQMEDRIIIKNEFLDVGKRSRQKAQTPNNQFKYFHRGVGAANQHILQRVQSQIQNQMVQNQLSSFDQKNTSPNSIQYNRIREQMSSEQRIHTFEVSFGNKMTDQVKQDSLIRQLDHSINSIRRVNFSQQFERVKRNPRLLGLQRDRLKSYEVLNNAIGDVIINPSNLRQSAAVAQLNNNIDNQSPLIEPCDQFMRFNRSRMPTNLHCKSANRLINMRDRQVALSQPPEKIPLNSFIVEPFEINQSARQMRLLEIPHLQQVSNFNPPSILMTERESSNAHKSNDETINTPLPIKYKRPLQNKRLRNMFTVQSLVSPVTNSSIPQRLKENIQDHSNVLQMKQTQEGVTSHFTNIIPTKDTPQFHHQKSNQVDQHQIMNQSIQSFNAQDNNIRNQVQSQQMPRISIMMQSYRGQKISQNQVQNEEEIPKVENEQANTQRNTHTSSEVIRSRYLQNVKAMTNRNHQQQAPLQINPSKPDAIIMKSPSQQNSIVTIRQLFSHNQRSHNARILAGPRQQF